MSTLRRPQLRILLVVTAIVALATTRPCLAAKGGNGNGKPGGGDPPVVAPVSYSVTRIAQPGASFRFFDHNNQAAMVGTLYDAPPGGRRALAYLPSYSPDAFYLDDPVFNLQGIPDGWHTRSAADISSQGTIVGNMELDSAPNTDVRPMYITGATSGAPEIHQLGPFDSDAWHELVASINDSGDMVVWSQKRIDGVSTDSLYLGNPGLYGEPAVSFSKLDFSSVGVATPSFFNVSLAITNRDAGGLSTVVGELRSDGVSMPFRVRSDGSKLEIGQSYVDDNGSEVEWYGAASSLDVNSSGDVFGNAIIRPAKNGKIKPSNFAAVWAAGSDEFVSAIGADRFQTDYEWAVTNEDRDLLLHSKFSLAADTLWHAEWSVMNGPISIPSLIDAGDPNRDLFTYAHELVDRNGTDWPTILARGIDVVDGIEQSVWLVLTPQVLASVTAPVPEPSPAIGVLMGMALLISVRTRVGGFVRRH